MRAPQARLLFCTAAFVAFVFAPDAPARGEAIAVCPTAGAGCDFVGGDGVQRAVDAAESGGEIRLRAGVYSFDRFRDVPFTEHEPGGALALTIRAGIVIDGKTVTLTGVPGARLDGRTGIETSAIAVRNARVRISNLEFSGFRAASAEDAIYDGHGIFAINSDVEIDHVTIEGVAKMAVTARGDTDLDLRHARLAGNHLGVWAEETSSVSLRNVVVTATHVAGVAAYDTAAVTIYNSVIEKSADDGVYTRGDARVLVTNSLVLDNTPYGLRAVDPSEIVVRHSAVFGNREEAFAGPAARVHLDDTVIRSDPMIGADYRPRPNSPLIGTGDPNGRSSLAGRPLIGLLPGMQVGPMPER
ncbi:MAG: right-handed parallel beta-helix repeat-containing protein [Sphingomonadales bacterium]|nr:right-handed parallel beta-helix repeat-containing protein [Sphingomonadales bacterium]